MGNDGNIVDVSNIYLVFKPRILLNIVDIWYSGNIVGIYMGIEDDDCGDLYRDKWTSGTTQNLDFNEIECHLNGDLMVIQSPGITHRFLAGNIIDKLTGAKPREWMGCWGLQGLLLLVMTGIIPENSLRQTHQ